MVFKNRFIFNHISDMTFMEESSSDNDLPRVRGRRKRTRSASPSNANDRTLRMSKSRSNSAERLRKFRTEMTEDQKSSYQENARRRMSRVRSMTSPMTRAQQTEMEGSAGEKENFGMPERDFKERECPKLKRIKN